MKNLFKTGAVLTAFTFLLGVSPSANAAPEVRTVDQSEQLTPIEDTSASLNLSPVSNEDNVSIDNVAGGQQATITLEDENSPTEYEFDLGLDDSSSVVEKDGFLLVEQDGQPVARLSTPWAYDADGKPVPTHFETNGKTVTQHIFPSKETAYPVTADPRWSGGNISGHIYFSKEETRKAAAGGASLAAIGPFWMAVPPPAGPAIAAWWEKNSIDATVEATGAVRSGSCLQLKVGYIGLSGGVIGVQPSTYTDGCS